MVRDHSPQVEQGMEEFRSSTVTTTFFSQADVVKSLPAKVVMVFDG